MRSTASVSAALEVAVLVWNRSGRVGAWLLLLVLFGVIYGVPMAMIALASVAGQLDGLLARHFPLRQYGDSFYGDSGAQLRVSLLTGWLARLVALLSGSWAALALRAMRRRARKLLGVLFFIPSAVPSVSVGLGLLVAFSRPPVLLNGTTAIVVVAHFILISAFTYGNVSAGLPRIAPDVAAVAASLGAGPAYPLRRVTLPP